MSILFLELQLGVFNKKSAKNPPKKRRNDNGRLKPRMKMFVFPIKTGDVRPSHLSFPEYKNVKKCGSCNFNGMRQALYFLVGGISMDPALKTKDCLRKLGSEDDPF